MKFIIKHQIKGRFRIHLLQNKMSYEEADILSYYLNGIKTVTSVKVYERTVDVAIHFVGDSGILLEALAAFRYEDVKMPEGSLETSGRELNAFYQDKLMDKIINHIVIKAFLPYQVRILYTGVKSAGYIWKGIRSLARMKLEVSALDAAAITVSILRRDTHTAGSIMFLLGIGEILEEWTHKKTVNDLARSMSLNVSKVWLIKEERERLVSVSDIVPGDRVVVHAGNVIPFDGLVEAGIGTVNQASLTGESVPVEKEAGGYVYAGTIVEEGQFTIIVKETFGSTRYKRIVTMIEETEKLKSALEGKAEHLADRLVSYTLLGTVLTYLITGNMTKALSVLMVDFSCALKLCMPIAVLSAIKEARVYDITVKGGKSLEAVAQATTIVFDKTGTLTKAKPTVAEVVTFGDRDKDEMLRVAACLEEHFPHPMARAVVKAAKDKELTHDEMHSKVDYIVAHGISSYIEDKKVIIGSYHFVFDDEKCKTQASEQDKFQQLPEEYSHLYLAIENELAAVICIEDPLRKEAEAVINSLRKLGINKVVMMTGDNEKTAKAIADKIGVDEYYSEVLPEDKAKYIEREKASGNKVVMIGDGINDSPALSAADAGIAISDGAEIAREIADVIIGADNLYDIVTLKLISNCLMKRIGENYRFIVGFNTGLLLLGISGFIPPSTSALLHNASTLGISLHSMQKLLA
ncbi:heavy metal translocating P-type ATPase [Clostridium aminobutyricum]|uniref:Cd(2+)-exporting ATPase n=1 Tax=Clostridium aminobutyricum TaxID=33953 RepID=A0A939IJ40_CLOAM|nr:heavy metal translocating P-type ATPase [Clostridium aminobutyricum]MBN7773218.1 heavy metal translocating P-type ATPase [Clostridium aminobutyricum]